MLVRTLRRELDEEVGIDVADQVHIVESTTFELDDGGICLNVVVLGYDDSGVARPVADDEVESVEWRSPDAILDDPNVPPWTKRYIERALVVADRSRREID